jgi:hypothetical protein
MYGPWKGLEGMPFRAWVAALEALGYVVEWRVIGAADLGDPTDQQWELAPNASTTRATSSKEHEVGPRCI